MGPYRQPASTFALVAAKKKPRTRWYGHIGLGLIIASFLSMNALERCPAFWPVPVCGTALAIVIIVLGQGRTRGTTRLARMAWHRGDRVAAAALFSGIATMLYSPPSTPNRVAKLRAAARAARVGMPKYRTLSSVLFARRDDET